MFKRRTPTKICQRRPGRKSRERSELSGHVGKGRELVGIGREMSVSVMGGGLYKGFSHCVRFRRIRSKNSNTIEQNSHSIKFAQNGVMFVFFVAAITSLMGVHL